MHCRNIIGIKNFSLLKKLIFAVSYPSNLWVGKYGMRNWWIGYWSSLCSLIQLRKQILSFIVYTMTEEIISYDISESKNSLYCSL